MIRSLFLVLLCACSDITREQPDAAAPPDTPSDGSTDTPDTPEPPPPVPREAREVVSAGARLTSTTYTLDVQIGHGVHQNKAVSTTYTFEGNAAVKP